MARLETALRRRRSRIDDSLPLYEVEGASTSRSTRTRSRRKRRRNWLSRQCFWCCLSTAGLLTIAVGAGIWFSQAPKVNMCPNGVLNDDYCDCPDGSDEPGTSACSHVLIQQPTFRCRDGSLVLFSSRVSDGVIDCPDGSDEFALTPRPRRWFAFS